MSIDAPGVLRHAADLLTGLAYDLLACNTTADGVWDDSDLEAEFSDLDNTAALLRVLADRAESDIRADAVMSQALNSGDGSYRP